MAAKAHLDSVQGLRLCGAPSGAEIPQVAAYQTSINSCSESLTKPHIECTWRGLGLPHPAESLNINAIPTGCRFPRISSSFNLRLVAICCDINNIDTFPETRPKFPSSNKPILRLFEPFETTSTRIGPNQVTIRRRRILFPFS